MKGEKLQQFMDQKAARSAKQGFPKAKWIQFCERFLSYGYSVHLYQAQKTFSKYVTVSRKGLTPFKVRFSDHKPIKHQEMAKDCDFFVGVTHTGYRTTEGAIKATEKHFAEQLSPKELA